MRRTKRQLFNVHNNLEIPDNVLRSRNSVRTYSRKIQSLPLVRWPNGFPCEAVNMYLIDKQPGISGGTLTTYASELSHIVRFCGTRNLPFHALTDSEIFEFSKHLQAESHLNNPTENARNKNTVRTIISRTLNFLVWYQDTLLPLSAAPLIGERSFSPQIVVTFKKNQHTKREKTYMHHRCMPTSESSQLKHPMPESIIEDIERTIETLSRLDAQKEPTLRRHSNNHNLLKGELEYTRARRRFMIWIMRRTGLRPAEMVSMPLDENRKVLASKSLTIPTMKRREKSPHYRKFPITLKDASVVARYLNARDKFIETVSKENEGYVQPNSFFLSVKGHFIKKESIEKDFERLVKAAGFSDVRACFSMFRHRFVTLEVIVHLKEFLSGSGKSRNMMTDTDYRSILKRVATKTGHKDEESLWHYIDIAWDEMNVWANTDRALGRLHASGQLYDELLELRHDLSNQQPPTAKQVLDFVLDRLNTIVNDSKEMLQPT